MKSTLFLHQCRAKQGNLKSVLFDILFIKFYILIPNDIFIFFIDEDGSQRTMLKLNVAIAGEFSLGNFETKKFQAENILIWSSWLKNIQQVLTKNIQEFSTTWLKETSMSKLKILHIQMYLQDFDLHTGCENLLIN